MSWTCGKYPECGCNSENGFKCMMPMSEEGKRAFQEAMIKYTEVMVKPTPKRHPLYQKVKSSKGKYPSNFTPAKKKRRR